MAVIPVPRATAEIRDVALPDVNLIYPKVFPDSRGFFVEAFNANEWGSLLGFKEVILQDNYSWSKFGVIRGLHAQPGMGKLVSVPRGEIFDVVVDIRPESTNFGKCFSVILSEKEAQWLWVPPGFAHGFQCISSDGAHVAYKCTTVSHNSATEFGICPFDPKLDIKWPITDNLIMSDRDTHWPNLGDILDMKERLAAF